MRFQNSIKNSAVMLGWQMLNVLAGFALRTVFVRMLGLEYLGVNAVMEGVLLLLSMTELGIGTSVAFGLYEPIEHGDEERIGALMAFYCRMYRIVAAVTAVLGLALVPFLPAITHGATEQVPNLTLIYLLFLTNTVLSYLMSYRRTLISANQLHYINSNIENGFLLGKYVLQAAVLIFFHSYIGYLVIQIVMVFASNLMIYIKCGKMYPFLNRYKKARLSKEDGQLMKRSVVSMMFLQLGSALVSGVDTLLINTVGLVTSGVYSNYSMIISTISRVLSQVFEAVTGSVGNLMVQKDPDHKYSVYREMIFTNFVIYFYICNVLAGAASRFIALWMGEEAVMPAAITFIILVNFFMKGMRQVNLMVIRAAGLFNYLRLKSVLEIIINFIVSVLFLVVLDMGVYGVLLGTVVSVLSTCFWWEPYVVHKYAFGKSLRRYFVDYVIYAAVTLPAGLISWKLCAAIPGGGVISLIGSGIVSSAVAVAVLLLVFGRGKELRSLVARMSELVKEKLSGR